MSLLSALFGIKNKTSDKIDVLDSTMFAEAISRKKIQLVDVRSPSEYHGGHIKNAVNIDFFQKINFEKSFKKMDKEKPVYLYCRSGARSRKSAFRLVEMGFSKIYDLKGGYMRWNSF